MPEDFGSPKFAPEDPTDGRKPLDWKTRYPVEANKKITLESIYLLVLLFSVPVLFYVTWRGIPNHLLELSPSGYRTFSRYFFGWIGGTLGGILFDLKWLYHSVARGTWNEDRRLWRYFTPHLSGALAFIFVVIFDSNLFSFRNSTDANFTQTVIAISFFVGYFSDNATAKLSDLAQRLFGSQK